jgi:hypothetical protein
MGAETLDMQVLLPAHFIFDQEPRLEQLLNERLTVDVVVGEHLRLELLGRTIKPAMVVCEIPCGDEE